MAKATGRTRSAPDYVAEMLARDAELRRMVDEELAQLRVLQDLIQLRHQRGLSQSHLARMLGVSQSAIAQLEAGTTKNLGIRTIVRVATALGARVTIAIEPAE